MPKSIPSRNGLSGGPRDATSTLLENILDRCWCQIGSIWELKNPPGTSKSFQKRPKTTFRFTDRQEGFVDGIVEQTSERLLQNGGGGGRSPHGVFNKTNENKYKPIKTNENLRHDKQTKTTKTNVLEQMPLAPPLSSGLGRGEEGRHLLQNIGVICLCNVSGFLWL